MARAPKSTRAVRQTASHALRRLRSLASASRAVGLRRFFRTGPGEYGEGDRFLGLTMPQLRLIASDFRDLPLGEIETLLESIWHEARALAVVLLADRYPKADPPIQEQIYRLYLRRADRINSWDLVDISAPHVVGAHLLRQSRAPLRQLARSSSLWERRIAMVATLQLIRHDEFDDTLQLAKLLMNDPQDLMHKATGWMLREVGKRDESVLRAFLDRHARALPRTALRYAIERLTPTRRKRYMAVPKKLQHQP